MGRKVERPKAGSECKFIPKAFKNDEDPEPIVVFYKQLTEGEKRRMLADNAESSMFELYANIAKQFVTKVTNYEMADVVIDDGEKLGEHGETEILSETAETIIKANGLTEDEAKK